MQINIKTQFPAIKRKLAELQADVANRALASAVNKTMAQAKTRMGREITREYNVTAAYVRDRLQLQRAAYRAGTLRLEAALVGGDGRKRSANVIRFLERFVSLAQARRRARDGTRGQLRFRIRKTGGKQVIPGAFIGNKGRTVFRRVGKERLPIQAVSTIDVPQMFNQRRINATVVGFIRDTFPRVFDNEARFFVDKFTRQVNA